MLSNYAQNILWGRFQREHRWTLLAEKYTLEALGRRWTKALVIPTTAIEPVSDQSFLVNSSTDVDKAYLVDPGGCTCPDSSIESARSAPYGWCKHRIATWVYQAETFPEKSEAQIRADLAMLYGDSAHPESLPNLHDQRIAEQSNHRPFLYRRRAA